MSSRLEVIVTGNVDQLDRALARGVKSTSGFSKGLNVAAIAAGGALLGLGAAAKIGFDEFSQGEKVAAQTAAVIKSTGGAAGVTAGEVDKLATSLMKKSGVDDEAIKSGQNVLLAFTGIRNEAGKGPKVFDEASKAVLDYSVRTGTDMPAAAKLFGKALNDPIGGLGALAKAGVKFTDGQKDAMKAMVESGDTAGAQQIILAELEKRFGGAAEAAGGTFAGKMNVAKESARNLAGELVGSAMPAIESLGGVFQSAVGVMERHKTATTVAVTAIAGLSFAVIALKVAMSAATTVATAFTGIMTANPFVLAAAAIAALAAAVLFLRDGESVATRVARDLAAANRDLAAAGRAAADASRNQTSALLGLQGANLNVKDSALALNDATARVKETNTASGRASGDHTKALLAQERAQLAVKQAQVAQATAAADTITKSRESAAATQGEVTHAQALVDKLRLLQNPMAQVAVGKDQAARNSSALTAAEKSLADALAASTARHTDNAANANAMAGAIKGATPEAEKLRSQLRTLAAQELAAAAKVAESGRIGAAAQSAAGKVRGLVAWLDQAARDRTSTLTVRTNIDRAAAGFNATLPKSVNEAWTKTGQELGDAAVSGATGSLRRMAPVVGDALMGAAKTAAAGLANIVQTIGAAGARPPNVAVALAGLTPGFGDDLAALRALEQQMIGTLWHHLMARPRGAAAILANNSAIIDAANAIKSTRDTISILTAVPALAKGGIVKSPTVALIGEKGPEAVVPLSGSGRGGLSRVVNHFHFHGAVGSRDDVIEWVREGLIRGGRRMPGVLGGLA
jgi:hypothetical protein